MKEVQCASGRIVWLAFVDDNKDGYHVEVYLNPTGEKYDDFVCVPNLGDTDAMKQYAIDYAKMEY